MSDFLLINRDQIIEELANNFEQFAIADPISFIDESGALIKGAASDFVKRIEATQNNTESVNRIEVIDHRQCVWCRGRMVANYLQKNGEYKEQPCDKCAGSGIMGGRVYAASSNPERSMIEVELSFQDDGRTLKVFVKNREEVQ